MRWSLLYFALPGLLADFLCEIEPSVCNGSYTSVVLDVDTNVLSGTLPPALYSLTGLRYLSLGSNQLSGTLAPHVGQLNKLLTLSTASTLLSATLPQQLFDLEELTVLTLTDSLMMSGTLTVALGGARAFANT